MYHLRIFFAFRLTPTLSTHTTVLARLCGAFSNSKKRIAMADSEKVDRSDEANGNVSIEIKKQLNFALPMLGTNLVQMALQIVSLMFVGHLGELQLTSSSIATSFVAIAYCSKSRIAMADSEKVDPDDGPDGNVSLEIKKQLNLALPMLGTNLVQTALQAVSLMFVGHLGELELSSSSIATSFANVTGYSLLMGLALALETLCGQAYGAKRYNLMGVYMQRAIFILGIVALLVSVVWFNMEHVLLLLGQHPDISKKAGVYARYLIPGLFAQAFLQPINKFLLTQGAVIPLFMTSTITLLLHTVVCWTSIYKLGLGIRGAALASSFSNWMDVIFQILIIILMPRCKKCWGGFSREAFQDIKEFLKLAIPSALMLCLEWWCYEILMLLSGILPNPQLETSMFSVMFNLASLAAILHNSISTAISIRVSNELGAGRPSAAKLAYATSMGFAAVDAVLISGALMTFRKILGRAYSSEDEVVDYVARVVPLLAIYTLASAFENAAAGVVRGCGKQAFAAMVNSGAYYVVGLPAALLLGFHFKLRSPGLLLGMLTGDIIQVICFVSMTSTINWQKEADKASHSVPLLQ